MAIVACGQKQEAPPPQLEPPPPRDAQSPATEVTKVDAEHLMNSGYQIDKVKTDYDGTEVD